MTGQTMLFTAKHDMRQWSRARKREGRTVGLVPTMGALHEGHLSLIRIARERCDDVVASVFVNPTQFAPNEDYHAYPRDLDRDHRLLADEGCTAVFAPEAGEMYAADASTSVTVDAVSARLCGECRPAHFRGVATVVAKLFNIVEPCTAVFGRKDAQQLAVIRRMVRDLDIPVEIAAGPIVREADGLAMSSRNAYLTDAEREDARLLYRSLRDAGAAVRDGTRDTAALVTVVADTLAGAATGTIDYIDIVDPDTITPVKTVDKPSLLAIAVKFGAARLIDNTILTP